MTIGTALSAAAAKSYILAGLFSCDIVPPPQVQVIFNNRAPIVTHALNHQEMEKFSVTTVFSRKPQEIFIRSGVTESKMTSNIDLNFQVITTQLLGKSCLSLSEVVVHFDYDPTVHIAVNYPKGSCHYRETWLHELKHVNTDIITITEFMPYFKKAMQLTTNSLPTKGPFPKEKMETHQKAMTEKLSDTLRAAMKALEETRQARQQKIDTRQEYMRLSKVCVSKP